MIRAVRLAGIAAAVAALMFLPAVPASSEILSRFHANGAHAVVAWEDGSVFGFISVSQDGVSAPRAQTFLFYEIDVEGEPIEVGFGYIPNRHLDGSSSQRMVLATDTTQTGNSDFTRLLGGGGPIRVTWQRDAAGIESGSSGTTWVRIGNVTTRQNGRTVFYGATAEGSALGFEINGILEANIGRHNNVTVEILRGP